MKVQYAARVPLGQQPWGFNRERRRWWWWCKQTRGIIVGYMYQAGGEPGLTKVRARAYHPGLGQNRGRIVAASAMDRFDQQQLKQKCNLVDLKCRKVYGHTCGKLPAGRVVVVAHEAAQHLPRYSDTLDTLKSSETPIDTAVHVRSCRGY